MQTRTIRYRFSQGRAQASGGAGAKWRYEATIVDRGGVCSPSARGITILCHVGFSILQAVLALHPN